MHHFTVWALTIFLSFRPGYGSAQATLILDDALSEQQGVEIRQVVKAVTERYGLMLRYQFEPSTVMVFSTNPSFLARDHTNRTGGGYAEKLQAFQNWINAEAGYRRIYVHVG